MGKDGLGGLATAPLATRREDQLLEGDFIVGGGADPTPHVGRETRALAGEHARNDRLMSAGPPRKPCLVDCVLLHPFRQRVLDHGV